MNAMTTARVGRLFWPHAVATEDMRSQKCGRNSFSCSESFDPIREINNQGYGYRDLYDARRQQKREHPSGGSKL